MAEPPRPPVAIRIVRPYETEEAFLESELETVGKTSIILIGAHSRPSGVILRFEVTLSTGATVLRGEGRVLAHKESAFRGQPGLALRFTRLDPRSKAVVDRAAAMREARLAGDSVRTSMDPPPASIEPPPASIDPPSASMPSSRSRPPSVAPDPVLAQILTSPTPPPPSLGDADERRRSAAPGRRSQPPKLDSSVAPSGPTSDADATRQSEGVVTLERNEISEAATVDPTAVGTEPSRSVSSPPPPPGSARVLPPPADRESLLSRLRERAAHLTPEQTANVLRSSR